MLVSFEVEGESEVDLLGYVTGLDVSRMMSLKEAMELSEASDDEDYKEEEEEEKESQTKFEPLKEVPRDKVNFSVSGYKHLGKFIKYKDIAIGTGSLPINGHRVEISYKLTLPTGEVLDSENVEHNTRIPFPTQFRVGLGHVVKGLDRAILGAFLASAWCIGMRVGGVREVLLAPEMGFDNKGNIVSDIRPGESFIVEVHLLGAN